MKFPVFPFLSILTLGLALSGCDREAALHEHGFHIPEGDPVVGQTTFVEMQCNGCHTVEGVELPERQPDWPPTIHLGGEIHRVKSYGDLVTSVIAPNHVVSPQYRAMLTEEDKGTEAENSPMPVYNDDLTVGELIDIVTFLHDRYRLIEPTENEFYYVMP